MKDKLIQLYIPFLIIIVALPILYTSLNWLVCICLKWFQISYFITNFAIPMVLSGVAIILVIRPRLKILSFKRNSRASEFYYFILWLAFFIPTIIAQEYMITATGELTDLKTIDNIVLNKETKYYSLHEFYLDKANVSVDVDFQVQGKHNQDFYMCIYLSTPILTNTTNSLQDSCIAWLGKKYSKTISNRLDTNEKERQYNSFFNKTISKYEAEDLNTFTYLQRLNRSDQDFEMYQKATTSNHTYKSGNILLIPMYQPFSERNGNTFMWIFISMFITCIVWLIAIAIPKVDKKQLKRIQKGKTDVDAMREYREFLSFIIPSGDFLVTPILAYINILVFLIMAFSGSGFASFDGETLVEWGANYGPYTTDREWWRLLTCIFLHGGIMHLLLNIYGLYLVGVWLEPVLGRIRYLIFYLITGVTASIVSLLWNDTTISIGASGAILGLFGVFIALMVTKVYTKEFSKAFLLSTLIFVGLTLIMGLSGGIDNAAHIGGLVSGFILGLLFYLSLSKANIMEE